MPDQFSDLTAGTTPATEDMHIPAPAPKQPAPDVSDLTASSLPVDNDTPSDQVQEPHKDFLSRVVDPILKSQFIQQMSGHGGNTETWLDKFMRQTADEHRMGWATAHANPSATPEGQQRIGDLAAQQFSQGQSEATELGRKPIVDLTQTMSPEELHTHPRLRAGAELASGLTSPENVELMLVSGGLGRIPGPAGKILPRLASGVFSSQQVYAAWEQIPAFKEAISKGDENEAQHILTLMTGELAMAAAGGEHAMTGEAKPVLPGMDRAVSRYAQIISQPVVNAANAARTRAAAGLEGVAARGEAKVTAHREALAALERQKMASKQVAQNALKAGVITDSEHANLTAEGAKPEDRAKFLHDRVTEDVLKNAAPQHKVETSATDDGGDFLMAAKKAASIAGSDFLKDPVIGEAIGKPSAQAAAVLSKKLASDTINHARSLGQNELADTMVRTAENHVFREASINPDKFLDTLNKGYETLRKNGVTDVSPETAKNAQTVRSLLQLRDQVEELDKAYPDKSWKQKLLDTATNRTGRSAIMGILGMFGGHLAATTMTGGALGLGGSLLYGTGKWVLSQDATINGLTKTARTLANAVRPDVGTKSSSEATPVSTETPQPATKTAPAEQPAAQPAAEAPSAPVAPPVQAAPAAEVAPVPATPQGPTISPRGEVSGQEYNADVIGAGKAPETKKGGVPEVLDLANEYNKQRGGPSLTTRPVPEVDPRAKEIADAYEAAPHNPTDPKVAASYDALKKETKAQWDFATQQGLKFEPWKKEGQPYANSQEMQKDVQDNKHLYFFQGGDFPADHPMGEVDTTTGLSYNDMFRAVHDLFGHSAHGFQFGPRGEEGAYQAHSQMFSPEAQPALLAETKAQNSWVNFGKHLRDEQGNVPQKGQPGYVPPTERPYGQQKAVVLPDRFTTPPAATEAAEEPRAPGAPPPEIAGAVDAFRRVGVDSEQLPTTVQSTEQSAQAAPKDKVDTAEKAKTEEEPTHDIREQFNSEEKAKAALPKYWGGEVFKEANRDIWHIRIPKGMRGSQMDVHELGHALEFLRHNGDVTGITKTTGGKATTLDLSSLPADPEGASNAASVLASGQGVMTAAGARMRAMAAGPASEGHVLDGVDPSVTKNWQDNVRDKAGKALSDRTKFGDLAREVGVPEEEVQGLWDKHVQDHKDWLASKHGAVDHIMDFVRDPKNVEPDGSISREKIHDLYERVNGERSPHAPKPVQTDARDILDLHRKNGGSTYNPASGKSLAGKDLYAVPLYPERSKFIEGRPLTEKDIADFTQTNSDLLKDRRNNVGTWSETKDGKPTGNQWLDVSWATPDRGKAEAAGKKYNQIAITHLKDFTEIPTGGDGKVPAGLPPEAERLDLADKKNEDTANYLDVKKDTDKATKAGFEVVHGEDPNAGEFRSGSWMHPDDGSRILLTPGDQIHQDVAYALHPKMSGEAGMTKMINDGWVRVHQQGNGVYNLMYELGDKHVEDAVPSIERDLLNRYRRQGISPSSGIIFQVKDANGLTVKHAAFSLKTFLDDGRDLEKTVNSSGPSLRSNMAYYLDTPNVESTDIMKNPDFKVSMDNIQDVGKALEAYTRGQKSAAPFFLNSTPREDMIGRATEAAVAEAKQQLGQDVKGKDWYSKDLDSFKDKMKEIRPELKKPSNMDLYMALVAITSNGQGPNTNAGLADKIFDEYQRLGKVPPNALDSNGREIKKANGDSAQWGRQIGPRSFEALNQLIADKGSVASAMNWLKTKHPVDEVLKYSANNSQWVKQSVPKGEDTYGSLMLGPKIGRFYQNLNGNHEVLTADRWMNRTWNRWMGTMFVLDKDGTPKIDPKTGKTILRESTENPRELSVMQETMERASKQLDLNVAELQATLWYYEKELWRRFGHDEPIESYSGAADYLSIKRGNRPTEVTGKAPAAPKANVGAEPVKAGIPKKVAGRSKRMTEEMAKGLE